MYVTSSRRPVSRPGRLVVKLPAVRRTARGLGFAFPTGYGAGACPINSDGTCGPGHDVDCTEIRECDDRTGKIHFEYALPGMTPNANINNYDASTGAVYYTNAAGQRVATPMGIPVPTSAQLIDPWSNPILTLSKPVAPPTGSKPTPPPPAPPPAGGGGSGAGGSGGAGGGSGTGSGSGSGSGSAGLTLQDLIAALKGSNSSSSSSGSGSFLTSTVSILGASVPVWALGVGGVVGLFALGGKR